ncbi:transposase [Cyclobacterium plantarum]|uniref:transposase n=1 Tax=Cyclobacterium plantarum TaxID=2716263 RepID=UPI003F71615F
MSLQPDKLYHFYNQGNNRETIFFSRENYLYFLKKFRKYVWPHCQVLAYCLMPNHFHFLINTTKDSVVETKVGSLVVPALNNGFRLLLSSYAQAINKQEGRSGSLFRQKTKAKLLEDNIKSYPFICFNYIHQNPLIAGLVKKLEDWEYSSFMDYAGFRNGSLCDQELSKTLLDISSENFYEESYQVILPDKVKRLF